MVRLHPFKGPSAKRDFAVCPTCFEEMLLLEKSTIRKLEFKPADHIIDNVYLGPEASAINLEYLRE